MAKLQGHFLRYRDQAQESITQAKTLLDIEFQIKDMSITEWLRRLNLDKFAPKFKKDGGIKRVADLKHIGEGDLTTYGIEAMVTRSRVMQMIKGDEAAKTLFALQKRPAARSIICMYLTDPKDIKEILDLCGEEQLTGYQLRDIFDETKNYAKILKNIKKIINENIIFNQKAEKKVGSSEEEKKDEKKAIPDVDIEKMLKSIGLGECWAKLKEAQINDPDIFFELKEDDLIGDMDLKTEGKKFIFKEKMKKVKDEHEKALAAKEQGDMAEAVEETFEQLRKMQSVTF